MPQNIIYVLFTKNVIKISYKSIKFCIKTFVISGSIDKKYYE